MNMPKEAEALYRNITNRYPEILWVKLGLASAYRMQSKYAQAEALLGDMIMNRAEIPEIYDLLASVQGDQGKYVEMQRALQAAVNISPKSLKRQRKLGDAALENKDMPTAISAYCKIIKEKYSHEFKPEDISTLVRLYLQEGDFRSARSLVDNNRKFLNSSPEGQMVVSVTMAQVSTKSRDTMIAKNHINNAL
jgi:tetratricopeptide (TPR) repeat protein